MGPVDGVEDEGPVSLSLDSSGFLTDDGGWRAAIFEVRERRLLRDEVNPLGVRPRRSLPYDLPEVALEPIQGGLNRVGDALQNGLHRGTRGGPGKEPSRGQRHAYIEVLT